MAEQHPGEGASTSGASGSNSEDSTVEINIKTLDSQMYNFRVDKNMPVSSFKGKVADQLAIPVGQQRLIFRGKVLKDDHLLSEYHVENGDTLHLVERQPAQSQTPSVTGDANTSGNTGALGNEGGAGFPRNRIGHISSHSVLLGTLNVGDQGDGAVPDLTQVIGAVLNSLGVGNQTINNAGGATQNIIPPNSSASQESNTEQGNASNGGQGHGASQAQFGQPFLSQPFRMPFTGASVPAPSLSMPIPDSLNTLSGFMTRLEAVLSENGYQPTPSPAGTDQPATELPSNARGLPTPEALSMVLRHAQRLMSGAAVSALSHIAERLEQNAGSTDGSVRSQIQADSVQVGLAMQHLGALLLELGRTILMLRMGQSPAEAAVNAGPAVYISPSGPNPIMVQPFPHQVSPLFNASSVSPANTGPLGPVGIIGSAPRNVNIHIHAGTSLTPMVSAVSARAVGGDVGQGEQNGTPASGDSGANRGFPVRNVIATAIPSRTGTITLAPAPVPNTSQRSGSVPVSNSTDTASLISEVNSRIRNFLDNVRPENQTPAGQQENSPIPNSSAGLGDGSATEMSRNMHSESSGQPIEFGLGATPEPPSQEDQERAPIGLSKSSDGSKCLMEPSSSSPCGDLAEKSECNQKEGQQPGDFDEKSASAGDVPLGLGGGLQPKRRSRQPKVQLSSGESGTSGSPDQSEQARTSGLQVLQSLASRSSGGRTGSNDAAPRQTGPGLGQTGLGTQFGAQDSDGEMDVTGTMSQLLNSPALNGLLSGVAQQTGVGSPDALRNMLQQFTQNPAMRNTVNQLAQQVDREDIRQMFGGMGTGQGGGGLDFSRMIQQMMPVVSQVLGGGSVQREQVRNMVPELLPARDDGRLGGVHPSSSPNYQNDLQEVVQMIALRRPSQDIYRAAVHSASERTGTDIGELVDEICANGELADQFIELLRCDLNRRLHGGST